jgi:hypothetical protein
MAKEVTDRSAAAEAVAAAAEAHAERVGEALKKRLAPHVPDGEEVPDMGVMLRTLARALRAESESLEDRSLLHETELADDAAPREDRDSATAAVVAAMVSIRGTVETVYGRAGLKAVGLDGRTPTDSKAIGEHARTFVKLATSPDLKLPKPQDGVAVDWKVLLKKVNKPLAKLAAARKDVAREEREAQITGNAKTRAMGSFDELFPVVATFTSAALELIGEDDLAARIKPSPRRRGVTAETEGDGEEAGDEAAGDEEAGDAEETTAEEAGDTGKGPSKGGKGQ